jgi:hypothetical protein
MRPIGHTLEVEPTAVELEGNFPSELPTTHVPYRRGTRTGSREGKQLGRSFGSLAFHEIANGEAEVASCTKSTPNGITTNGDSAFLC